MLDETTEIITEIFANSFASLTDAGIESWVFRPSTSCLIPRQAPKRRPVPPHGAILRISRAHHAIAHAAKRASLNCCATPSRPSKNLLGHSMTTMTTMTTMTMLLSPPTLRAMQSTAWIDVRNLGTWRRRGSSSLQQL